MESTHLPIYCGTHAYITILCSASDPVLRRCVNARDVDIARKIDGKSNYRTTMDVNSRNKRNACICECACINMILYTYIQCVIRVVYVQKRVFDIFFFGEALMIEKLSG